MGEYHEDRRLLALRNRAIEEFLARRIDPVHILEDE